MGNLPSWEELESQADQVADDIFSGVESSLTSFSDMDLDNLRPEEMPQEEASEKEESGGRFRQVSREEWMLLGTALSSVVVAGSLWLTLPQINSSLTATAKEAPAAPAASLPPASVAVAPIPAETAAVTQEEKILQRYKQDIQATKTALGTTVGNKVNPFFPSVKITQPSGSVAALPPGSQQPFQVAKSQTPPVQFAQPVTQQPAQFKAAQPVAALPPRYNIPPLPRILPAPPNLRPLRGNGALPPAPPSSQPQTAAPSPAPVNPPQATPAPTTQSATTQSIENAQVSANNSPQVKQQPQAIASATPAHSLIGIMGTGSKRQTALIKSGDSMREVLPGEQLGSGWTLQSIAENQVTLQQQGGQTKVLTLGDP